MKSNETKKTNITENVISDERTGYGTNELSVFISERTGYDISGKKLRKYLRKIIPENPNGYRNYNFRTLNNPITERLIEMIETDFRKRTERKKRSDENRKKRSERKTEFIDDIYTVDNPKPETETKPKRPKIKK